MPKIGKNAVAISFQFEEGKPYSPSIVESMAKSAFALVKHNPLAVSQYPFFDVAKVGDWFAGREASGSRGSSLKHLRLKAIKFGAEILLEHNYRSDGRLAFTHYADGEMVRYEWDDLARTVRVQSRTGRSTLIKLGVDDLVEALIYESNIRFQYEYDISGRACRLTYPDGVSSQRSYGHEGELTVANVGGIQTEFRWETTGVLDGFTVTSGLEKHEFRSKVKSLECSLAPALSTPAGLPTSTRSAWVVHPLGAWRMHLSGEIEEMVTPFGDRFRIDSAIQGRPATVWSPSGRHHFDYAKSGGISGITGHDGSRSMFYAVKNQAKAILVSLGGVAVLEYDDAGHLCKRREGNGNYCLYSYGRNGRIKKIDSFRETLKLSHDKRSLLASVNCSNGCACKLDRSTGGALQSISISGLACDPLSKLSGLLGFLWQWLALRSTWRLESLGLADIGTI